MTIVRFPAEDKLVDPLSVEDARIRFGDNAKDYLNVPGLLWKAYLLADDGQTVGGTYWWTDRASAAARFTDGWLAGVTKKYGRPPSIEWFEAPVVVDARFDVVRVTAPPEKTGLSAGGAPASDPTPATETDGT